MEMKREHFESIVKGFGLSILDWNTYKLLRTIEDESSYDMDNLVEKLNDVTFYGINPIDPERFFAYLKVMDTYEYPMLNCMYRCYARSDTGLLDEILENGFEETKKKVEAEYREWCDNGRYKR